MPSEKVSTIPAPPEIEIRAGRPVVVKSKPKKKEGPDPFVELTKRALELALPADTKPVRDLLLIEKDTALLGARETFAEENQETLEKAGWWPAFRRMLDEIERSPVRRMGDKLPAILVVDGEMRLAWLEVKMNEAKS